MLGAPRGLAQWTLPGEPCLSGILEDVHFHS